jgi:CDP-diacylglycerol--serine O-phosphatidyltransferase
MSDDRQHPRIKENQNPRIYLLPNLMTAGNLLCGFMAVLKIVEGALLQNTDPAQAAQRFELAILFILTACICDALDGRLARLGGQESAFGREFDSLADIVSFGVAPALMVYKVVLIEFPTMGWIVASLYLLCGALRLARFNCLAAIDADVASKEFRGFPIPAAAGLTASLTLFMLWMAKSERDIRDLGPVKWLLPALLIFLSFMMFSRFQYPSFKGLNWRTTRSIPRFIAIVFILGLTIFEYYWMPAVIFLVYLLYGFLRPFLSRRMQREIEEEILEEDEESLDLGETPPHTVEENAPSITNAASATSTKPSQS